MSHAFLRRQREPSPRWIALLFSLSLLCTASVSLGQDAVRPSLAGEAAAEARRQDIDRIPYNLLMGPIRFRVSASAGVEYNSNINYSEVNEQEDVIITPNLTLDAIWPMTQLNTLRLDLGIGYRFYLDHSENNTNAILIAPNSQIAFDIFVGDFRINIHDRMSLQQDPIDQGALSNVADYGRFENTAGVSVLWDLNQALVSLGYDHYNFVSITDQFDYLDRNAEILFGSIDFLLTPTIGVGPEANVVFTRYDEMVLSNADSYSVGGFIEAQITNNLRVRAAAGYQWMDFDRDFVDFFGFLFPDQGKQEDWYGNILIGHRINNAIRQTLAAGHESQLGVNSNFIELNYVRHTLTLNVIRGTLLSTEFFYEDADESGGLIDEQFQRWGAALALGYQLTPHITLGLRYQFTQKNSDVPLRDYDQHRVGVDGTYSF
ncbi:MAG: outer membrane beta-barrel protein [Chthoniobacterales bacterium]